MGTTESPSFWQRHSTNKTRRALLTSAIFTTGVVVGFGVDQILQPTSEKFPKPKDLSPFPQNTIDHFQIGQTGFAFSKEFSPERRKQIKEAVAKFYPRLLQVYGSEPTDASGKSGFASVFAPTDELQDYEFIAYITNGLPRHDIRLGNTFDDFTVAEALSSIFWGPLQIAAAGKNRYFALQPGITNAVVEQVQDPDDQGFKFIKRLFKLEKSDPNWANKEKAASYGSDFEVATGTRRLLAAKAMLDAIDSDKNFLPKFRQKYYTFVRNSETQLKDLDVTTIRRIFQDAYVESFRALQDKHKILSEAQAGRHVLIAPSFDKIDGEESLAVFVFERDASGLIETPLQNMPVQVFISENKNTPTVTRLQTDKNGTSTVILLSDLPAFASLDIRVTTSFATDDLLIHPRQNNNKRL